MSSLLRQFDRDFQSGQLGVDENKIQNSQALGEYHVLGPG